MILGNLVINGNGRQVCQTPYLEEAYFDLLKRNIRGAEKYLREHPELQKRFLRRGADIYYNLLRKGCVRDAINFLRQNSRALKEVEEWFKRTDEKWFERMHGKMVARILLTK